MTLYRQLVLYTLVLFFVLFAGTWLVNLESTRSFLIHQLESHAQDTATSLGVSISQYSSDNDLPAIESMINAVFDRGYYRVVRYTDTRGNILIDRTLDVTIENVPQWFISLIPLKTPEASANVMAGWLQAGTIFVKSHPGYAYRALWENVVRMTGWFLACGIFVLLAGGFVLRRLLQPLVLVEKQADALCRKEYEIQEPLPRTRELRRVVEAMNRMTRKVKEMFEEQVAIAEGLRSYAYHDGLTGLGNRRYFESQINARLNQRDRKAQGILLIVQINDLLGVNQRHGREAGDELLQRVGSLLQESTRDYANVVLARLTGGDFGIYVPDITAGEGGALADAVSSLLGQLAGEQRTLSDNIGHIGAVVWEIPTSLGHLLSEADLALRSAQLSGPNACKIHTITDETAKRPRGQQQWKETLEQVLSERKLVLWSQPVVNFSDRNQVMHLEVFSRIVQADGNQFSAGLFMPFAERLQLVSSLDRIVLEDVMQLEGAVLGIGRVAVNVSPASIQNDTFRRWLLQALEHLPEKAVRINFEFAEFGAVQHLDALKEFSKVVRQYGHGIGLDHFGRSFANLGYLQALRPDYVKIDKAYTDELQEEGDDSRFFISSLCSAAHSLDIKVIAEGVETEEQRQLLKGLNLDALQGYIIARPKPLLEESTGS
jgi:diguanylate cyclase (GGDEF)-like protein